MAPHKGKKVLVEKPMDPISSYEHFVNHYRQMQMSRLGAAFNNTAFIKSCAQLWPTLNPVQLEQFTNMAAQDRERYRVELQEYRRRRADDEKTEKRKKPKKVKDPNAPKRPLTAFFWFCNEERARVRERNPEFKGSDIAKELGRLWRESVDSERKNAFQSMAQRDKERYQRELTAYQNAGTPTVTEVSAAMANPPHQQSDRSQRKFPGFDFEDIPE